MMQLERNKTSLACNPYASNSVFEYEVRPGKSFARDFNRIAEAMERKFNFSFTMTQRDRMSKKEKEKHISHQVVVKALRKNGWIVKTRHCGYLD